MTAKEWLSRGRKLDKRLHALEESRRQAYERATSAVSSFGKERTSSGKGGRYVTGDEKMERYAAISLEMDRQAEELEKIRMEILQVIDRVNDNTLCALLTGYYVNGQKWEDVADGIGYTVRHTSRLHKRALEAVKAITGYD